MKSGYVYILASSVFGTLYVGVTSDLKVRTWQHKHGKYQGFTKKHQVHKLVWYQFFEDISDAIKREKQIKKWKRDWKINLIVRNNPDWVDLYQRVQFW